ncbi:MAG: glycine zipper 2TM domain-containing protein [Pseudorhodoferax sp.]
MRNISNLRAVQALAAAAALLAGNAMATEYGTVVSKTAVYSQVAVPVQQCVQQDQVGRAQPSGAGALIGALVGGGAGNLIGHGGGRALATGVGVLAGAITGNRVEADGAPTVVTPVQTCQQAQRVENRLVGFDVVYDYNGQRYSTRLASDPGDHVPLAVSVAPANAVLPPAPVAYGTTTVLPAVAVAPAPVVVQRPWAAPVGVEVDAGWGWGGRHWR